MSTISEPDYSEIVQTCLCTNLRAVTRAVTNIYDESLKETGLRITQFTLLVAIALDNTSYPTEESNLQNIASLLFMDLTTLTRAIRRLEENKLVSLEFATDRRTKRVELTDEGKNKISFALPHWKKAQKKVTNLFGEGNVSTFLKNLGNFANKLK